MDFSVQITGLDQIANASAAIKQAVADEINKAVYASAQQVRTEAIKSIQDGDKTGRIYHRRSVTHQASAPGEAPASDTGALASRGIVAELSGPGEATATAGGNGVIYASMLEFGTSKMAARPFMIPALEKSKAWIVDRLQQALQIGLGK